MGSPSKIGKNPLKPIALLKAAPIRIAKMLT
jgi:hypothetical protein